jgi:hypothetical protein
MKHLQYTLIDQYEEYYLPRTMGTPASGYKVGGDNADKSRYYKRSQIG